MAFVAYNRLSLDAQKLTAQVYQQRAQGFAEVGDGGAQLQALQKWIRAAGLSGDPGALAQAHMQFGLAQQQQVCCQQSSQSCLPSSTNYLAVTHIWHAANMCLERPCLQLVSATAKC